MKSKSFQAGGGSLGEARRPRTLEEFPSYNHEEPSQRVSTITVLVGEDDDDCRFMMRTLLEMKGYRVVDARSGDEAVAAARSEQPDLVLLDLELAGVDGLDVVHQLRLKDETSDVPIVMISGWDTPELKNAVLAAGCNEYLLKPLDFDKLDALVNRYVRLR